MAKTTKKAAPKSKLAQKLDEGAKNTKAKQASVKPAAAKSAPKAKPAAAPERPKHYVPFPNGGWTGPVFRHKDGSYTVRVDGKPAKINHADPRFPEVDNTPDDQVMAVEHTNG